MGRSDELWQIHFSRVTYSAPIVTLHCFISDPRNDGEHRYWPYVRNVSGILQQLANAQQTEQKLTTFLIDPNWDMGSDKPHFTDQR